jgi:hypothetical protein
MEAGVPLRERLSEAGPRDARRPPRSRLRRVHALALALGCSGVLSGAAARAAEPTKDQCIDANERAQGMRKSEKLHAAEQTLLICVSASCPGPVRDDCAQRLTELRSVIPTVVFVVKDDADQDLSDVTVTMDDQPLASKLDGTAIAIDPGQHHFVIEAAGKQREERSLVIREGEKDRHERIVLVTAAVAAAPVVPTAPVAEPPPPPEPEAPAKDGKTQRIAGLVVGGVGAAGLVVGGIFGIVSKSTYNHALTECTNGASDCSPTGVSDGKSAHSQAAVSTVAFIAGGALLAGGVLLYFTAPRAGLTVSPTVGMGSAGLSASGSF